MVSKHWPTYVLLSVYVLAMIIVAIIANIKNRKSNSNTDHKPVQNTASIETHQANNTVITHFLGAKNFGFFVLLLTTFASIFSGYTLVGVPDEAGAKGFFALRWVAGIMAIGISFLIIFPRIRRLSVLRNYESPGDFINDRYDSKVLCILVSLCLCIPQLFYLAVQVYSLGAVLSNLTDGELSFYAIIGVSSVLILIFEFTGGMRSVAYTDAVQASVMLIVFITIPIVLTVQYGGFIGQVADSEDLPCDNSNEEMTSGCLNYANYTDDDGNVADEYYVRSPSSLTTVNYILFTLALLSFSLNPHVMQRAFAAQQDWQVKFVTKCIIIAGFVTMIPGILLGISYLSNKPSFDPEYQEMKAFSAMLAVFRDQGGFVEFMSYVALLAGIAGIMSTADSSLIGVSNTISCDVFQNWLTPNAEPKSIVYIGEAVSFVTMLGSVGIAIYIKEAELEYGMLLTLQQGILWQAFPAYVFGLYTNIGTKSILYGIIVGVICDIIFVAVVFSGNDPFEAIDPSLVALDKSWSSLTGVLVNLIVCFVCHFVFGFRDYYNNDDRDYLGINKIREIMNGITEPVTKYYGIFVWLFFIFIFVAAFHWIGQGKDPELVDEFGEDGVKSLIYNGYIQNVIAGLPQWTFASIMWYVAGAVFGIYATSLWTTDDAINKDQLPSKSSMGNINISEEQRKPLSPRSKQYENNIHGMEIESNYQVAYVDEEDIDL